jgi:hypothetical protein
VVVLRARRILLGGDQGLLGGGVRILEADSDLHLLRRLGRPQARGVRQRQVVVRKPHAGGAG